jgi:uncharacterized protein YcsI (UPF0317 family)
MEDLDLSGASPQFVRELNRTNALDHNTSGFCDGYTQANLVMLPSADAFDFLRFAVQNPDPCPILEVTGPGQYEAMLTAPGSDLRTDVGRYEVYRHGQLSERRTDVRDLVGDDTVCFVLGCSYSFEHLLTTADIPIRHHQQGIKGAPMYITNRACVPAGRFAGSVVVTMRPIPAVQVTDAVQITAAHPEAHGAPVCIGAPEVLGIRDLNQPDWGDPVRVEPGDVPVFWACGVTAAHIAQASNIEFMITHASGFMFVTDLPIT